MNTELAKPMRYYSLDVFRGATVAFMIVVNSPGTWAHLYSPLEHAKWHGLTLTDLVYPFFLFAVGNAMAFVMPRLRAQGDAIFWKKVISRTLLIFLIGLFLNWFPFVRWQDDQLVFKTWTWVTSEGNVMGVRILGVLQRIALCYFFASVIVYFTKPKGALIWSIALLLIYWVLCLLGNPSDPYSIQGWYGNVIDKLIIGEPHLYHGEGVAFEPEALMSTIPSIVNVVFGYLFSFYLLQQNSARQPVEVKFTEVHRVEVHPVYKTLTVLFVASALLLLVGYAWGLVFPINKKLWTSSYVLFTSGLATIVLATLIYFIEVRGQRSGWRFFDVFGKNPLFIYALSGLIPKTLAMIRVGEHVNEKGAVVQTTAWSWYYEHVAAKFPGPPENGSLFFAVSFMLLLWAVGYWMDKKKIYVRV